MKNCTQFYINGQWVFPQHRNDLEVINPATEQPFATISMGSAEDANIAIEAARRAFDNWSQTSREQRLALLERLLEVYMDRYEEMAQAISMEMGAPITMARKAQAGCGAGHLKTAIEALREFKFEHDLSGARVVREPIGVCGFITPWNWPINQIACKVAPALATGCTMVLKPSEIAPVSAYVFSDMMHDAGFPAGVYNMVNGDGPSVGAVLASHPEVDMVSITGSTRAGVAVAQNAAPTVKRVAQELGGKSPNLILPDADLEAAVKWGVFDMMSNTGQSCNAPSRMLVHKDQYAEAEALAVKFCEKVAVGNPAEEGKHIGPVSSQMQFDKIQGLINKGIEEGCRVVIGGPGKPEGLQTGYYCKPTIFADVNNQHTIAREEIFGPVLVMIPYSSEEEAIKIANDTPYGLAAYVHGEPEHAKQVARRIRAGMVHLNGAGQNFDAPFGGFKQSGNGREWGAHGFEDFLETKAINGFNG